MTRALKARVFFIIKKVWYELVFFDCMLLVYLRFCMYILFCNSLLSMKILSGSKKINWNRVKDIGLVRFQVHSKLPIGYVFGHAISVWVWILPENSSGTQSMRNILFRLGIFGYFGYVDGVTDILLTFKFGFLVIVLDKFSKF